MSENVNYPVIGGNPFTIPDAGEEGWPELTQYLVALAQSQSTGPQKIAARVATSSPVTIASASDCLVAVKLPTPGAVTVNLPAGVVGQWFAIADGTGDAATNNISIIPNGTDKIAGNSNYLLAQDGASVILGFTGAGNWSIMAQAAGEGSGGGVSRSALDAGPLGYVLINNPITGLMSSEHYLSSVRGGLGADASTFTGIVKAAAGVFSASALANTDIPSGIDAAKIGGGTVSTAQFNFLSGVSSNIQTQLNGKQAAGNYITALVGDISAIGPGSATASIQPNVITNSHINGAAGIAFSKMEVLTVGRVPITDGSGKITTGATTAVELGYVAGVTSAIQTQLDTKVAGPASVTSGQLAVFSGTTGKVITNFTGSGVLKVASGIVTASAVDLATGNVTGILPIANGGTGQSTRQTAIDALVPIQTGNTGKFLQTDGATVTWQTVTSGGGGGLTPVYSNTNVAPAVSGNVYLMDSTSASRSVTLPAGASGSQIMVVDDKGTGVPNAITVSPATGQQIGSLGVNTSISINVSRGWIWFFWDGSVWAYITSSASAGSGGLAPVAVTSDVALAAVNTMYSCTSTGGLTITLPPVPAGGGVIGVMDGGETCSDTNFIRITPAAGQTLDGGNAGDSLKLDFVRANVVLYAAPTATSWKIQYQTATISSGSGGLNPVQVSSNVALASNNTMYLCTSTNGLQITLPAVPSTGGVIGIIDAAETCSATNYIDFVAAAGQTLDGYASGDIVRMDFARANIVLYAAAGSTSWKLQYQATTMVQGGQLPAKAPSSTTDVITDNFVGQTRNISIASAVNYGTTTALNNLWAEVNGIVLPSAGVYEAIARVMFYRNGATFSAISDVLVGFASPAGGTDPLSQNGWREGLNNSGINPASSSFGWSTSALVVFDGTNISINGFPAVAGNQIRLKTFLGNYTAGQPLIQYICYLKRIG